MLYFQGCYEEKKCYVVLFCTEFVISKYSAFCWSILIWLKASHFSPTPLTVTALTFSSLFKILPINSMQYYILHCVQPPFCHISLNSLKLAVICSHFLFSPPGWLQTVNLLFPVLSICSVLCWLFFFNLIIIRECTPAFLSHPPVSPLLNKANLKPPACRSVSLLGFHWLLSPLHLSLFIKWHLGPCSFCFGLFFSSFQPFLYPSLLTPRRNQHTFRLKVERLKIPTFIFWTYHKHTKSVENHSKSHTFTAIEYTEHISGIHNEKWHKSRLSIHACSM